MPLSKTTAANKAKKISATSVRQAKPTSQVELLGQAPIASDRQSRPLSPATRAGDFVFVSGQVPTDEYGQVILGGIEAQTRQVFKHLEKALAYAGCGLQDVAKVSVWAKRCARFLAVLIVCIWNVLARTVLLAHR